MFHVEHRGEPLPEGPAPGAPGRRTGPVARALAVGQVPSGRRRVPSGRERDAGRHTRASATWRSRARVSASPAPQACGAGPVWTPPADHGILALGERTRCAITTKELTWRNDDEGWAEASEHSSLRNRRRRLPGARRPPTSSSPSVAPLPHRPPRPRPTGRRRRTREPGRPYRLSPSWRWTTTARGRRPTARRWRAPLPSTRCPTATSWNPPLLPPDPRRPPVSQSSTVVTTHSSRRRPAVRTVRRARSAPLLARRARLLLHRRPPGRPGDRGRSGSRLAAHRPRPPLARGPPPPATQDLRLRFHVKHQLLHAGLPTRTSTSIPSGRTRASLGGTSTRTRWLSWCTASGRSECSSRSS